MNEVKNTGINWIGKVPKHWICTVLKRYCKFKTGTTPSTKEEKWFDGDIQWFTPADCHSMLLTNSERTLTVKAVEDNNLMLVPRNTVLIVGIGATAGNVGITECESYFNQQMTAILANKELIPQYLLYWIVANSKFLRETAPYTTLPILNNNTLSYYDLLVPPIVEQQNIIKYLDSQCAKIDTTIAKRKAIIEKLKEYKIALITKTVTKGLNPDVAMKDSGIDWLGKIPNHWNVIRIKFLANNEENSFSDGDWIESPFITNSGIRYYTSGNVGDGEFKEQGDGYITEETFDVLNCKFAYPGDLVFSRLNAPYGRSCILPDTEPCCVLAVDNVILRTDQNKKFITYVTQCEGYHLEADAHAVGTAMRRISRTNLGKIKLPIPPLEEQEQIVSYLDARCSKIDEAIEKQEQAVAKLEEYRKSIIYYAVIGKIDCRDI